jgi:hypothetical protein
MNQPIEDPEEWVMITDPNHIVRPCDQIRKANDHSKWGTPVRSIGYPVNGWVGFEFRCRRKDLPHVKPAVDPMCAAMASSASTATSNEGITVVDQNSGKQYRIKGFVSEGNSGIADNGDNPNCGKPVEQKDDIARLAKVGCWHITEDYSNSDPHRCRKPCVDGTMFCEEHQPGHVPKSVVNPVEWGGLRDINEAADRLLRSQMFVKDCDHIWNAHQQCQWCHSDRRNVDIALVAEAWKKHQPGGMPPISSEGAQSHGLTTPATPTAAVGADAPVAETALQKVCNGCGSPLRPENAWMTDGCPCNSPAGVNSEILTAPVAPPEPPPTQVHCGGPYVAREQLDKLQNVIANKDIVIGAVALDRDHAKSQRDLNEKKLQYLLLKIQEATDDLWKVGRPEEFKKDSVPAAVHEAAQKQIADMEFAKLAADCDHDRLVNAATAVIKAASIDDQNFIWCLKDDTKGTPELRAALVNLGDVLREE